MLAACGSGYGTPSPNGAASPPASAVTSPAASTAASTAPQTGQTDTEWGRIWDSLPADFPTYPGAAPAGEAAAGPASATLTLDGDVAQAVSTWMAEQLKLQSFAVDPSATPLEDGRYVVDARREAGCRVEVTATPTGGQTTVTVRYGADCPKP